MQILEDDEMKYSWQYVIPLENISKAVQKEKQIEWETDIKSQKEEMDF